MKDTAFVRRFVKKLIQMEKSKSEVIKVMMQELRKKYEVFWTSYNDGVESFHYYEKESLRQIDTIIVANTLKSHLKFTDLSESLCDEAVFLYATRLKT